MPPSATSRRTPPEKHTPPTKQGSLRAGAQRVCRATHRLHHRRICLLVALVVELSEQPEVSDGFRIQLEQFVARLASLSVELGIAENFSI